MRSELARGGIGVFLRTRNLQGADGRALHQYGVTDGELNDLQWYLQSHDNFHWKSRDCGALVLVLAEWGQRNARTAHAFIQDAINTLGLRIQPEQICQRLDEGLIYWRRRTVQPQRYAWNAILLLEGGLPRHMSRTGLEELTVEIASEMSWSMVADAPTSQRFTKFLDERCQTYPGLLAAFDDRLFWHHFFMSVANYYRDLAKHAQLPSHGEAVDKWLLRIRPPAQPTNHLSLRTNDHDVFIKIIFPGLAALPSPAWQNSKPAPSSSGSEAAHSRTQTAPSKGTTVVVASGQSELGLLNRLRERGVLGQPLYTYRVTSSEFEALREEVRRDVRSGRFGGSAAGRFCLYASEQLCRSYTGGPWNWDLVLKPIGWDPTTGERAASVRAGLEYWQRRVLTVTHRQQLLMTLVCEGGLPLNLLTDGHDTYFKQFFRALIQNAERFKVPASRFIEEQISLLPSSFRDKTVIDLSSRLADAVVGLRAKIPVGLVSDPLEYLQQSDPNWNTNIPLRVNDDTFREFLRGLIAQPTERSQLETPIEVSTVLHRLAPVRIERRATCADTASVDSLAQLLGISSEALKAHTRIVLSLVTVTGERHQVAIARLNTNESQYNLERLPISPIRHEAGVASRVLLSATVGEREFACSDLPGGGPLLTSVPWVFEGGDRQIVRLLTQGSLRVSANELIVLAPQTATLQPSSVKPAGITAMGRDVLTVHGTASWNTGDELWTVSTAAQGRPAIRFVFVGLLCRSGFSGSEYWGGLPRLEAIDESNNRSIIPSNKIEVRLRGTHVWQPWGTLFGDLEVRVRDGAETTFRGEVTTLPVGTKISMSIREASVSVRATGLEQARLATGDVVKPVNGECCMKLPDGVDETTIPLHLVLRTGRGTITVPSPLRMTQFIGREGVVKGPVVLDRIGRIRARAVSPDAREVFALEVRVQGRISWLPTAQLPRLNQDENVWELSLDAIRDQLQDVFAATGTLDAEVEVRLSSSRSSYQPSLKISRYEAKPIPSWVNEDQLLVDLEQDASERIGRMGLDLLQLQLRPLADPDQVPTDVLRVSDQRWSLSAAELSTAPTWLVTGSIRNRVRLRPLLITSRTFDDSLPAADELNRLMRERDAGLRSEKLDALVSELDTKWERPEWEELPKFIETFGILPAPTFDVLRAVARDSSAAASVLLRCGGTVELLRTIWKGMEELPFLWSFVPVSAWQNAARQLERWAHGCANGDDARAQRLVRLYTDPFLETSEYLTPFLIVLHDLFGRTISSVRPSPAPYLIAPATHLQDVLRNRAQEMLARHSDEWWPTNLEPVRTTADVELGDDSVVEALEGIGVGHRQPFLKIPYLVGLAAGSDQRLARESVLTVRRLRTFDPVWFDVSHAIGFSIAAGARLRRRQA